MLKATRQTLPASWSWKSGEGGPCTLVGAVARKRRRPFLGLGTPSSDVSTTLLWDPHRSSSDPLPAKAHPCFPSLRLRLQGGVPALGTGTLTSVAAAAPPAGRAPASASSHETSSQRRFSEQNGRMWALGAIPFPPEKARLSMETELLGERTVLDPSGRFMGSRRCSYSHSTHRSSSKHSDHPYPVAFSLSHTLDLLKYLPRFSVKGLPIIIQKHKLLSFDFSFCYLAETESGGSGEVRSSW